uniref:Glycosyltransferase n=1 Tax=Dictyoglomus thermophilum TaxID=14 RepID=A0A7C3MKX3_DICTH
MNIVIIRSNQVNPDPRVEKLAEILVKKGNRVVVLAWNRNEFYLPSEQIVNLDNFFYKIIRVRIPGEYGKGLSNLFPILKWQMFLFLWLVKNKNIYNIIHACDFDTIIPSIIVKLLFKKKVIYDIFDYYTDSFKIPFFLRPIIRFLDKIAMKISDKIILCDEIRLKQISFYDLKKIEIVQNIPKDLLFYFKGNPNYLFRKNCNLTLAYVGILQEGRFIKEMIEIFKKHLEWNLIIGGFGPLESEIIRNTRENIIFLGRLSYIDALRVYYESDAIFAIYDPSVPNHKFSSPNKLFEAMMLSKPIIVAKGTGIDKLVMEEKIGLIVDYGNIKDTEDAIRKLEDKLFRDSLGLRGRKLYERKYNWQFAEKKVINIYNELNNN